MAAENQKRYRDFLAQYNDTLPADISDDERRKKLLEALDAAVAQDLITISEEATTLLSEEYDKATIQKGEHDQAHIETQLDQVRQAL